MFALQFNYCFNFKRVFSIIKKSVQLYEEEYLVTHLNSIIKGGGGGLK